MQLGKVLLRQKMLKYGKFSQLGKFGKFGKIGNFGQYGQIDKFRTPKFSGQIEICFVSPNYQKLAASGLCAKHA